jgi:hypothetical protein
MRLILTLAVTSLLALSGCLDGDGDGATSSSSSSTVPPDVTPGQPTVVHGSGTITASGPVLAIGGASIPFTVDGNVTLLFAEIAWDDPVQDIDLALASPSAGMTGAAQNYDHLATGGMPGAPDSPHSLTLPAPEAGGWQASAFANIVAAQIEYRIAVTLFYGETAVPEGYTAL